MRMPFRDSYYYLVVADEGHQCGGREGLLLLLIFSFPLTAYFSFPSPTISCNLHSGCTNEGSGRHLIRRLKGTLSADVPMSRGAGRHHM